jgi:hypothetical protein
LSNLVIGKLLFCPERSLVFNPERSEGSLLPKILFAALAALLAVAAFGCQAQHPNTTAVWFTNSSASKDELAKIPNREFTTVETVESLPNPVKTALASAFKQESLSIANPGDRFNPSDVMNSHPSRRLIFAGCTKEKCVVHYEKGGRGLQYLAIVFRLDGKQNSDFLWAAVYSESAGDLRALRAQPHSAVDQRYSF